CVERRHARGRADGDEHFILGRWIEQTGSREGSGAGFALGLPANVARFAIEGDDGAFGLTIIGDVHEIIDDDRRLAVAMLFPEWTDIVMPDFPALVSEGREHHTAVLEPEHVNKFGIDGGRARRIAVEAVDLVRGASIESLFPERFTGLGVVG